MPALSTRGQNAPPSPIRKLSPLADAARARGTHVYHVNIGQPDLPTPQVMRDAVRTFDESVVAYSPSAGTPACREALTEYYRRAVAADLETENLLVTTAGSEAILFAMAACANPGESVLVPEPLYPNYLGFAALLGVDIQPLPCSIDDGYHLPADLDRFVDDSTRAILFANPGNPTGTVYRRDEIEAITDLAVRRDLFVIGDEVYREFVFEGEAVSVLTQSTIQDRAIAVDSTSKRYSACGIRVGALVSRNLALIDAANRFAMARLSPPAYGQRATTAISSIEPGYFDNLREIYRGRRDTVIRSLRAIPGVTCPEPEGAFYTMAGLPIDDADDFARFLLEEFTHDGATTMLAPGSGFYATPGGGKNEVRVAYVLEEAELERAIEVMALGLEAYRERAAAGSPARASAPGHTPSNA